MESRYETMKQDMGEIRMLMFLNGSAGCALTILLLLGCRESIPTENVLLLGVLILVISALAVLSLYSLKQGFLYHGMLHALKNEKYETVDDWIRTQTERKRR
jgi:hypothetical protein